MFRQPNMKDCSIKIKLYKMNFFKKLKKLPTLLAKRLPRVSSNMLDN